MSMTDNKNRRKAQKTEGAEKTYTGPYEKLIFDKSIPGQVGFKLPPNGLSETGLDPALLRTELPLPEVAEPDVVRHFVRLSRQNYSIDSHFYPLGSCTMKYNPRINEETARTPGLAEAHPLAPDSWSQGALKVFHRLQRLLLDITGFDGISIQPVAGAQSEFVGMLMIHAYFKSRGEHQRTKVLIPDSAHGTNPATCTLAGFETIQIKSGKDGLIDLDELKLHLNENLAGIMLTNPNTLGLFETNIAEVARLVHEAGGQVYCDGANMNALVGTARPGDMGVDVMHLNLHKTFSTPHGGGGPGAGTACVKSHLIPFLPVPVLTTREDGSLFWDEQREHSSGRVHSHHGNFGILVRALTYILSYGSEGLREISEGAVLKANYLRAKLRDSYNVPFDTTCMHEVILNDKMQQKFGVKTMDIAKRIIDFGFHPPTVYFPLIVPGAMMIEPTETESKATLDEFITAMKRIAREAEAKPERLLNAPHSVEYKRLDEVRAAKQLDLNYFYASYEE